jgi:hypothetical protein
MPCPLLQIVRAGPIKDDPPRNDGSSADDRLAKDGVSLLGKQCLANFLSACSLAFILANTMQANSASPADLQ